MASGSPSDFPEYFIVEVKRDSGLHYVVCEAVVAVKAETLPPAVASEVSAAFTDAVRGQGWRVCALPNPGAEGTAWMALQMKTQISPPRP